MGLRRTLSDSSARLENSSNKELANTTHDDSGFEGYSRSYSESKLKDLFRSSGVVDAPLAQGTREGQERPDTSALQAAAPTSETIEGKQISIPNIENNDLRKEDNDNPSKIQQLEFQIEKLIEEINTLKAQVKELHGFKMKLQDIFTSLATQPENNLPTTPLAVPPPPPPPPPPSNPPACTEITRTPKKNEPAKAPSAASTPIGHDSMHQELQEKIAARNKNKETKNLPRNTTSQSESEAGTPEAEVKELAKLDSVPNSPKIENTPATTPARQASINSDSPSEKTTPPLTSPQASPTYPASAPQDPPHKREAFKGNSTIPRWQRDLQENKKYRKETGTGQQYPSPLHLKKDKEHDEELQEKLRKRRERNEEQPPEASHTLSPLPSPSIFMRANPKEQSNTTSDDDKTSMQSP